MQQNKVKISLSDLTDDEFKKACWLVTNTATTLNEVLDLDDGEIGKVYEGCFEIKEQEILRFTNLLVAANKLGARGILGTLFGGK